MTPSTGAAPTLPAVTVAVSTFRRKHLLPRLVSALEAQTIGVSSIELVIVDDASQDGTAEILTELAASSPMQITVLVAEVNGGPAVGRNRAWRVASAEVIAFTDDDCVPTPGWLEAGLAAAAPGNVVVGQTQPAPDQLAHEGVFSRTLRVTDARFMQTCNVIYQKQTLLDLDGFEESFRTGEDTDLGLRAVESGLEAVFVPEALVHHDVRPSDLRAKLRESRSWVDLPLVVRRHPQVRKSYLYGSLFWKKSHPLAILFLAAPFLALLQPAAAVLVVPWLWWRWRKEPLAASPVTRLQTLPAALLIDLTEVYTMVRGSLRHGALVL